MDIASARWFSELGMDDYNIFQQFQMNSLNEEFPDDISTVLKENFQQSLSSESHSSYPTVTTAPSGSSSVETCHNQPSSERPAKQRKTTTSCWNNSGVIAKHVVLPKLPSSSSSSSQLLSFENSNSQPNSLKPKDEAMSHIDLHFSSLLPKDSIENVQDYNSPKAIQQGTKRSYSMSRTPSHAQEHIIAERKRREKLSQRFIALSGIVPGLKKMDKASVLGDTIKYVKQLQERVKVLEEQTKKRTVESVVFVKKSQFSGDDDSSSCDENFDGRSDEALPEIEVKVSEKDVLIRIHCEKQRGVTVKILSEIEKLQLSVVNSSILPFGNSTLDITVVAQMDDEFSMTVKDLVKILRMALLKFM
ncbi:transcription factor bHLH18-like [Ziziphus jujuba]|uniref:Transcription factor bHLH18-like n=1 Tax=Ziziphus jujuba TaxID=326968 RepID=A0ABM3IUG1_ZIZJJ|nr:transcription factor bHLH18-like [Ziziphus jujuba]